MILDSALLLLIGLGLAGLLRVVLSENKINRFLKGSGPGPVFKAALIGVPLPLCSCSVLPVAHQMRRSGISRGGTVAFLISTPESGVDSIALTYSLLDPVMTVARPVTAFLTAFTAGLVENRIDPGVDDNVSLQAPTVSDCCSTSCGCETTSTEQSASLLQRMWSGLKYAYTDLLNDLAVYLVIGYLLAGLISAVWGPEAGGLPEVLRTGWGSYIGAIVVGLPLYICAVSSTPLAAALFMAGFSPGATLLFLMVGPATNIASLVVVGKILKGWAVVRYLLAIVLVSLAVAVILDFIYLLFRLDPTNYGSAVADTGSFGWVHSISAVLLTFAIIWYSLNAVMRRLFSS